MISCKVSRLSSTGVLVLALLVRCFFMTIRVFVKSQKLPHLTRINLQGFFLYNTVYPRIQFGKIGIITMQ